MLYWWPLAKIHRPSWFIYSALFILSTLLSLAAHWQTGGVLCSLFVRRTVEIQSEFLNSSDVALTRAFGKVPAHELFDHHRS